MFTVLHGQPHLSGQGHSFFVLFGQTLARWRLHVLRCHERYKSCVARFPNHEQVVHDAVLGRSSRPFVRARSLAARAEPLRSSIFLPRATNVAATHYAGVGGADGRQGDFWEMKGKQSWTRFRAKYAFRPCHFFFMTICRSFSKCFATTPASPT